MKKIEIPVKFSKEDTVYTIKKIKLEKSCPICEGRKTIEYKGKNMRCPECMGKGSFISEKQINVVCDEPYKITKTIISVNDNENFTVKYRGYCGNTKLNRSEMTVFSTIEEAQAACDELNKEKVFMNINDIIIPKPFNKFQPTIEKVQDRLEYYKTNGIFYQDIIINKENVLKDGYITYKICKLLNIDTTKVIIEKDIVDNEEWKDWN